MSALPEHPVEELHARLLDAWNRQDAIAYAEQFTSDAIVVGFDGSEIHGRARAFQNTPARYDGRPDAAEALTQELRSARAR